MNQNEIITAVVALMVCGLLAGVTAIPLIAGISQETTTEEYNDESNAGWLRMAYDNKPFDVEITADGGNISAGGQTGLNDDMILYADASACVMSVNGAFVIVNGYAATPEVINATSVAITNAGGSLTVEADGDAVITADSPAWAYYPDATGKYAYFGADVDGVKIKASDNHAFAGTFAGVYAYNNTVVAPNDAGDLGLSLNAVVEDDIITSVTWGVPVGVTPSYNTPVDLDTSKWETALVGLNNDNLRLITYNGTIADAFNIPTGIISDGNTYNTYQVGQSTVIVTDSQIPDGTIIKIPNSTATINRYAFQNTTHIDGCVILPNNITVSRYAFDGTSGLDSLILTGSVNFESSYINSTFSNSGIKEVLNLGSSTITTTTAGLNADEVRDDVPASGYIAPLSTTIVVTKEGAVYDLISLLPLIMVLGIVMMGVYAVGTRYA